MMPKSGCRFSEKIMLNNKLKRNDGSTHRHFRFRGIIAANEYSGQPGFSRRQSDAKATPIQTQKS
jgi:hypothetical protein